jgi:putative transposase
MSAYRFSTGRLFTWKERLYQVNRLLPDGEINLEDHATGAILIVPVKQLVDDLFDGKLKFVIETRPKKEGSKVKLLLPEEQTLDLSDYPAHLVEKARFRLEVIKPLVAIPSGKRTRQMVEDRVKTVRDEISSDPDRHHLLRGLTTRNVYRWLSRYEASNGDIRALIDNYARSGGKGKSRLPAEVSTLLETVIKDHYYRRETVTIDDILHLVAARMEEENRFRLADEQLKLPDRATVARRIDALDMRERFTARHGKHAAKHEFDQVKQMSYPTIPLERVEIDHTSINVIVVDETDNLPLGRPTLTFGIDVSTRFPLGYYAGFEPPSYYTVMECLYHLISPKPDIRHLYGTEHSWPSYGIPATLVVDNGKEFVGRDLEDAALLLGMTLIYAPVRTPEFKATVERKFRTIDSGLFHTIDGTTFSNIFERGDYNSVRAAVITLAELEQMLNIFVIDVYAERFHTGLNGIPARRWQQATQHGFFPRLPANNGELPILLGRVERRVIQRYGIEFMRLRFNHASLSRLRHQLKGQAVKFKYHPGDLSRIYVHDPFEKVYLEIPATDQAYTHNLSLWKHRVILNLARQEANKVDLAALGRAKLKIQGIVDVARSRKRVASRRKIARWDSGGRPPSLDKNSVPDPTEDNAKLLPSTPTALPATVPDILLPEDDGWELAYIPSERITPAKEQCEDNAQKE